MGVALLNAVAKRANYKSRVVDFNIQFKQGFKKFFPNYTWQDLEHVFNNEEAFRNHLPEMNPQIEHWVDLILAINPRFLGISVFTSISRFMSIEIIKRLQDKKGDIKIIVGGGESKTIGPDLKANGLIDFFVNGEGEDAILRIAKGEPYPGVNDNLKTPPVDVDKLPIPDYSDIQLDQYQKFLYVTGSRGCPRNCTFCEVNLLWPKFRLKKPELIVQEMVFHVKKYGINSFYFTDSLINGSMKHFRALCQLLKQQRENNVSLTWESFFILRNQKTMVPEDFDLAKESGARLFKIGFESGSQRVVNHMQKNYKLEEQNYFLEQFERVGLRMDILLMVGYPTETRRDFEETKAMLIKNQRYLKSGTIANVRIAPAGLVKDTPLYLMKEELGIIGENYHSWANSICDENIRHQRYLELHELVKKLGFPMRKQAKEMFTMLNKATPKGI